MKSAFFKFTIAAIISAIGVFLLGTLVIGPDIIVDQSGHVTIETWKHPGKISFQRYDYPDFTSSNDSWWPKVKTDKQEPKAPADLSQIITAEKTPEDSPFLMTIAVSRDIVTGIEEIRLLFIGNVTIEPAEVTQKSFLFHISKSSGIKVTSPFAIQYKKDGVWQPYKMPLFDQKMENETQSGPQLNPGDTLKKLYEERRKEELQKNNHI